MRKSRFTEGRIVDILRHGETGAPIAEILRQHNISKALTISASFLNPLRANQYYTRAEIARLA